MIPVSVTASFLVAAACTGPVPIILLIVLGVKRKISALPLKRHRSYKDVISFGLGTLYVRSSC